MTLDASIVEARKVSDKYPGFAFVVHDNDTHRDRVHAFCGRAVWLEACTKCDGTGEKVTASMYGGLPHNETCKRCDGTGCVTGLPCA